MAHRLREIREAHNLTQTQMGEIIGLSLRGYQYVEKGERDLLLAHIDKFSEYFNLPSYFFLVDPEAVYPAEDRKIVAAYKALDGGERKAIDKVLFPSPNYSLAGQQEGEAMTFHDKQPLTKPDFNMPDLLKGK